MRTVFLASGLHILPKTWPTAAEHAAIACNISAIPTIAPSEKGPDAEITKQSTNRWAYATGSDFKGIQCALGQLVYYRVISPDKTQANAIAGIFGGWRVEPGPVYKGITKVFSFAALKNQSGEFWKRVTR